MVDFNRPITVVTNGKSSEHRCEPNLLTALKSIERRHDWGLVYHATITVNVD